MVSGSWKLASSVHRASLRLDGYPANKSSTVAVRSDCRADKSAGLGGRREWILYSAKDGGTLDPVVEADCETGAVAIMERTWKDVEGAMLVLADVFVMLGLFGLERTDNWERTLRGKVSNTVGCRRIGKGGDGDFFLLLRDSNHVQSRWLIRSKRGGEDDIKGDTIYCLSLVPGPLGKRHHDTRTFISGQ
jgi:hypothetical protein